LDCLTRVPCSALRAADTGKAVKAYRNNVLSRIRDSGRPRWNAPRTPPDKGDYAERFWRNGAPPDRAWGHRRQPVKV